MKTTCGFRALKTFAQIDIILIILMRLKEGGRYIGTRKLEAAGTDC